MLCWGRMAFSIVRGTIRAPMSVTIVLTLARRADAGEMARFLAPIPNADRLAAVLADHQNVASRAYEDATETARFVASDGVRVKCFAVAGITIDQAEMIAAAALDWMALDEVQGARAVALALGPTV